MILIFKSRDTALGAPVMNLCELFAPQMFPHAISRSILPSCAGPFVPRKSCPRPLVCSGVPMGLYFTHLQEHSVLGRPLLAVLSICNDRWRSPEYPNVDGSPGERLLYRPKKSINAIVSQNERHAVYFAPECILV